MRKGQKAPHVPQRLPPGFWHRRIADTVPGLKRRDVLMAWSHDDVQITFVTSDHRHGWHAKKGKQWGWWSAPMCRPQCEWLFGPEADARRERAAAQEALLRHIFDRPAPTPADG